MLVWEKREKREKRASHFTVALCDTNGKTGNVQAHREVVIGGPEFKIILTSS